MSEPEDRVSLINRNLAVFGFELQELIQQGYEIDINHPINTWGFSYECELIRYDKRTAAYAKMKAKRESETVS